MTSREPPVKMGLTFLEGTGTMSDFDVGVPGIMVFGILLTLITAAMTLVREHKGGTLRRMKLTRMRAADLLGGVTLAHGTLALVQVPLVLLVAVGFGFTIRGSIAVALLIGLLMALAAIGIGLVVACFARSDAEAANLGSMALVPLAVLSGAMFPMPEAPAGEIGGIALSYYDLLPTTHASEALRQLMLHGSDLGDIGMLALQQVLCYGARLPEVAFRVGAMAVLSLLLFGAGVATYERLKMSATR